MNKIGFLLILVFLIQSRKLNITCEDCSADMDCSVGSKCFTFAGNDGNTINEEVCSTLDACPFSAALQWNAVNCGIDYSSQACVSEVCVAPISLNICENPASGICSAVSNVDAVCGTCKSTPGCTYCLETTVIATSAVSETCVDQYLGLAQCDWTASLSYNSCSNDDTGNFCSCCSTPTIIGDTGICTTGHAIWSLPTKLGSYILEPENSTDTDNSSGHIVQLSLLVCLIMILF